MVWVLTVAVAILYIILVVMGIVVYNFYKKGKDFIEVIKELFDKESYDK